MKAHTVDERAPAIPDEAGARSSYRDGNTTRGWSLLMSPSFSRGQQTEPLTPVLKGSAQSELSRRRPDAERFNAEVRGDRRRAGEWPA